MARYKRILGGQLQARTLPGQQAEAAIGVAVLNRMIDQARPNSVRAAGSKVVSGFGASAPTSLHQHPFFDAQPFKRLPWRGRCWLWRRKALCVSRDFLAPRR
ncbi:hypothetical protein [Azospirillum cavernae]|uniref:hypothetical protein n=1 Tax=Azospirillum cavernae TaxID=2320860 RepID=UPI0011C4AAE7